MKHFLTPFIFCMIAIALLSCADTDTVSGAVVTEPTVIQTDAETLFMPDEIPSDLDLEGTKINILIGDYFDAFTVDMYSETLNGNRLSDAVYTMTQKVRERLNVDLIYTSESYTWAQLAEFEGRVIAQIMAGDGSIDILFDVMNFTSQMLDGQYFINLTETAYIDVDKPWYNHTIIENMPDNYVHFLSGDFALANVKHAFAMYYNAELLDSLGITDNLYDVVDNGSWTMDKLTEMISGGYHDLNGDGISDPGDRYGLTFGDNNKYLGFIKALGMDIYVKESDGYSFRYANEHALNIIDSLCRLVNENENVLPAKPNVDNPEYMISAGGGNYASKMFVEGNALFSCGLIADAMTIVPSIYFNYGILPYPKYSEEQNNYATMLQRSCYALIPTTVSDEDAASAVLEALSSESYRTLMPEYCEITLKTRYSQDDDVSRMFDLIRGSITYDPGEIYANLLGFPSSLIKTAIDNNDANWASQIAAQESKLNTAMEKILSR